MQELSVLLTLAAVFAIALVSPGPDVALVVRTSLHQGRRAGLASALGLVREGEKYLGGGARKIEI